jgi:hypothetical protein
MSPASVAREAVVKIDYGMKSNRHKNEIILLIARFRNAMRRRTPVDIFVRRRRSARISARDRGVLSSYLVD